jgi:hypothetical protein
MQTQDARIQRYHWSCVFIKINYISRLYVAYICNKHLPKYKKYEECNADNLQS